MPTLRHRPLRGPRDTDAKPILRADPAVRCNVLSLDEEEPLQLPRWLAQAAAATGIEHGIRELRAGLARLLDRQRPMGQGQ
jgi:hypothetical protein